MTATAARTFDVDSSSADDHDTIDVVSHATAAPYGTSQLSGDNNDDDDDDDDDDEQDEYGVTDEEYAYRRGHHSVPMNSPGEELSDIDLMADQHLRGGNMPRLPRLRNRVFFQNDDVAAVRGSSSSSGGARSSSRRVLFRRRKRQEGDVFWTAIFVSNVLSLAVLGCLVVYLTQTDFFASHQKELFGTTVDNRFTVVSQQDARAKIYLKSGYSNSRYSEAMIAFGDGVLQLGRRALTSTDAQRFYGLSLSHNGTSTFTNKVSAPFVTTEYLHAGKAVVFEDGSVMTTAANLSGGVKEIGDLNLVSANGSVVTSAGGKPVLIVDPLGKVVVPSADADNPSAMGVVVDGAAGRISIGGAFHVGHNVNASTISTTARALHVNATRVVFGIASADKVTLTVPRPLQSPSATTSADNTNTNDNNDDDTANGNDDDATDDDNDNNDGANDRARVLAVLKPMNLEIVGQSSSSQSQGGDVWIGGGDGLDSGGNVIIAGGVALDLDNVRVGSVAINAQLDPTGASFTEIGTQSSSHVVSIQGAVQLNGNASASDNVTQVAVGGAAFHVQSQRVVIDNAAANASQLELDSRAITIGKSAPSITIGGAANSTVTIHASAVAFDGAQSVAIGANALHVSVGSAARSGQLVELVSDSIRLSSSSRATTAVYHGSATGTASVRALANAVGTAASKQYLADVAIANGSVHVDAHRLSVGAGGQTASIALSSPSVTIGKMSLNSSVAVGGKMFSVSSDTVALGSEDSRTTINGESISLDASDSVQIGADADSIALGNNGTADVSVAGKTIAFDGAIRVSGTSLVADSTEIMLGGKATSKIALGDASTKQTFVAGEVVEIGAKAASVAVGTESPVVSIGSTAGVINLRGKVMLNGAALESRHRGLRAAGSWFAYLGAERFAIEVASSRHAFELPVSDHFVSVETAAAIKRDASAIVLHMSDDADSGHARLALTLSGVRLKTVSDSGRASSVSKLRCRVYRQRPESSSPAVAVLEAAGTVEHCMGSVCDDDVFFSISSEQIIAFDGGDRFDVRCFVVSSTTGSLLVDGAQLSFVTL